MTVDNELQRPNYSLRNRAGTMIWLPDNCLDGLINLDIPNVFDNDHSKQRFPIGTIAWKDLRRFVYVEAGAAIDDLGRLVSVNNYGPGCTDHEDEDGFEGALYATASAGDTYVDVADTGALAKNDWEGGYFISFPSGGPYVCIRIAGNDIGNESTHVRVYLDDPLPAALTTSDGITVYRSPFKDVKAMGNIVGYESAIGVPLDALTSGRFGWVQTWGPAWVTAHGGSWPGDAAEQRMVYAHQDGTCDPASVKDPSSGYQQIGWLISATVSSYGDAFVFLTIM